MHSKSNNVEFMIYCNADKVMEEFLEISFNRQQIGLETSMFAILFLILFIYCFTNVI